MGSGVMDDDYNKQALDWLTMTHQPEQPPDAAQRVVNRMQQWPGALAESTIKALMGAPEVMGKMYGGELSATDPEAAGKTFETVAGLASPARLTAQKGAAGIFGGRLAKGFDPANFDRAEILEQMGAHPEHIYDATGLFRDAVGNWMHKISDKGLTAKNLGVASGPSSVAEGQVGSFVSHPDLFKAYPKAEMVNMKVDPTYGSAETAVYMPKSGFLKPANITIGGELNQQLTPQQLTTLVHELNHHVQHIEDFPHGGSPATAGIAVMKALQGKVKPGLSNDEFEKVAKASEYFLHPETRAQIEYEMYHHLPGEVASRNAANQFLYDKYGQIMREDANQHILNFHPTGEINPTVGRPYNIPIHQPEYRKYPWKTEDVARKNQYDYILQALRAQGK
jgi:hypothetical protein